MNWKQLLSNIGGAALVGAAGVAKLAPAGSSPDWKTIGMGAAVTAIATVFGLFQTPPHQG